MYDLSRPITLDKVQPMYAFHPQSRVRIADDETRLKMTPDQVRQFVASGVGKCLMFVGVVRHCLGG
jgi:hypothetical protein